MATITEAIIIGTATSLVSDGGSTATSLIRPAMNIPVDASSIRVSLRSSFIWNNFPNINATLGNKLKIRRLAPLTDYIIIQFPTGQYSLEDLQDAFLRESQTQNAPWIEDGESKLSFIADDPSQKIYITNSSISSFEFDFDYNETINSTGPTIWKQLGFNQGQLLLIAASHTSGVETHTFAPNTAVLNTTNVIYLRCSAVSRGVRDAGEFKGILASVPITQPPGHLMVYEPEERPINEQQLAGSALYNISITLTNEFGELINTPGNDWFVIVNISYDLLGS